MSETFTVEFEFERATKNTFRFAESSSGQPPKIGTLYVQKWSFSKEPRKLKVTIETIE